MTPEERAELLRLAEAATPRPWKARTDLDNRATVSAAGNFWIIAVLQQEEGRQADAEYIIAACNAAPALARRVEELEALLRAMSVLVEAERREYGWDEDACAQLDECINSARATLAKSGGG